MITLQKIKNVVRFREIVSVLIRQGFGGILDRLNLPASIYLPGKVRDAYQGHREANRGRRLRLALQDLGPTFIKLGQILSTRTDIFSDDVIEELERLQSNVPPFPFHEVEQIVVEELGRPVGEVFASFAEEPIAAASIGQVHRARLKEGDLVAVKVQRPGVPARIRADLDILDYIAQTLEQRLPESRVYSPTDILREIRRTLTWELDYVNEALNMEEFARNFDGDGTVSVPSVRFDLTSARLLVMEYVSGTSLADVLAGKGDWDRPFLARAGLRAVLRQIFEHGFFHADPHPGNLRILDDRRICFLDFGMMGRIDRSMIYRVTDILVAIAREDFAAAARSLVRLGEPQREVDLKILTREVHAAAHRYFGLAIREASISRVVAELFRLAGEHQVKVPGSYALMVKAFTTMDEIGKRLDPELNVIEEARPFIRQVIKERWHPETLWRASKRGISGVIELLSTFPFELSSLVRRAVAGQLSASLRHEGLEDLTVTMDKVSNRLAFALVISALIIGSSILIGSGKGGAVFGTSVPGLVGYILAGALGLWLLLSIIRSGRL